MSRGRYGAGQHVSGKILLPAILLICGLVIHLKLENLMGLLIFILKTFHTSLTILLSEVSIGYTCLRHESGYQQ